MDEDFLDELVTTLVAALRSREQKQELIKSFQQRIWDSDIEEGPLEEVLGDLAYDLDFYEPDSIKRSESGSFFGDERADEKVRTALRRLRDLGIEIPASADV